MDILPYDMIMLIGTYDWISLARSAFVCKDWFEHLRNFNWQHVMPYRIGHNVKTSQKYDPFYMFLCSIKLPLLWSNISEDNQDTKEFYWKQLKPYIVHGVPIVLGDILKFDKIDCEKELNKYPQQQFIKTLLLTKYQYNSIYQKSFDMKKTEFDHNLGINPSLFLRVKTDSVYEQICNIQQKYDTFNNISSNVLMLNYTNCVDILQIGKNLHLILDTNDYIYYCKFNLETCTESKYIKIPKINGKLFIGCICNIRYIFCLKNNAITQESALLVYTDDCWKSVEFTPARGGYLLYKHNNKARRINSNKIYSHTKCIMLDNYQQFEPHFQNNKLLQSMWYDEVNSSDLSETEESDESKLEDLFLETFDYELFLINHQQTEIKNERTIIPYWRNGNF